MAYRPLVMGLEEGRGLISTTLGTAAVEVHDVLFVLHFLLLP